MENQTRHCERCVFVVGKTPTTVIRNDSTYNCIICSRLLSEKMVKCEICHVFAHDTCVLGASQIEVRKAVADTTVNNTGTRAENAEEKLYPTDEESASSSAVTEPQHFAGQTTSFKQSFNCWKNRLTLFSRFDSGVMLDKESFQHVCPEILAHHIAMKCKNYELVLDPFCGTGSNAIQLALAGHRVIAVDANPKNILLAKKNAQIYHVADRIFFRVGDCYEICTEMKADAIVTYPPWGKRTNKSAASFNTNIEKNADEYCERKNVLKFLQLARNITTRVVLNVDKNFDCDECLKLVRLDGFSRIKLENISMDGVVKYFTFYLTHEKDVRNAELNLDSSLSTVKIDVHFNTSPLSSSQSRNSQYWRTNRISAYRKYLETVDNYLDDYYFVNNFYVL